MWELIILHHIKVKDMIKFKFDVMFRRQHEREQEPDVELTVSET